MLTMSGSPAKSPRLAASKPCRCSEVRRQPCDAEVEDHAVRDVHDAEGQHVSAGRERAPVSEAGRMRASDERSAVIVCSSSALTAGMLRGIVPEPGKPDRHPHEAHGSEPDEDLAPGQELEQPQHQRRGQAADEVSAREEDALGRCLARAGVSSGRRSARHSPTRRPRRRRKEPDAKQREVARCGAGGCGEARPPHDDARQHQTRAPAVCPPRGRNLEQRVCELERSEDISHLHGRQAEIPHDPGRQRRDACPIQVGNHRQAGGEGYDRYRTCVGAGTAAHYMRRTEVLSALVTC
jgi:hypothetical protein